MTTFAADRTIVHEPVGCVGLLIGPHRSARHLGVYLETATMVEMVDRLVIQVMRGVSPMPVYAREDKCFTHMATLTWDFGRKTFKLIACPHPLGIKAALYDITDEADLEKLSPLALWTVERNIEADPAIATGDYGRLYAYRVGNQGGPFGLTFLATTDEALEDIPRGCPFGIEAWISQQADAEPRIQWTPADLPDLGADIIQVVTIYLTEAGMNSAV